jgi:hypothetical protein
MEGCERSAASARIASVHAAGSGLFRTDRPGPSPAPGPGIGIVPLFALSLLLAACGGGDDGGGGGCGTTSDDHHAVIGASASTFSAET